MKSIIKTVEEQHGMMSDELLFYAGIIIAVISLLLLIVLSLCFRLWNSKLNEQFDHEYGIETRLETHKGGKTKETMRAKHE